MAVSAKMGSVIKSTSLWLVVVALLGYGHNAMAQRYLYSSNSNCEISRFRIESNGSLTQLGSFQPTKPVSPDQPPDWCGPGLYLYADPQLSILFALRLAHGTTVAELVTLRVSKDGALTTIRTDNLDYGVSDIELDRTGRYLFIGCENGKLVSYSVSKSGVLKRCCGTQLPNDDNTGWPGIDVDMIRISHSGRWMAVLISWCGLDMGGGCCFFYRIGKNGFLHPLNKVVNGNWNANPYTDGGMALDAEFDQNQPLLYVTFLPVSDPHAHSGTWLYRLGKNGLPKNERPIPYTFSNMVFTKDQGGEGVWTTDWGYQERKISFRRIRNASNITAGEVSVECPDFRTYLIDKSKRSLYVSVSVPDPRGFGQSVGMYLKVFGLRNHKALKDQPLQTVSFRNHQFDDFVLF